MILSHAHSEIQLCAGVQYALQECIRMHMKSHHDDHCGQSLLHRSDHGQKLNKMALELTEWDTRNLLHCFLLIVIDYLLIAMQISFRRTNTHSGTEPVDSVARKRPYILTWCGIRVQRAMNIP